MRLWHLVNFADSQVSWQIRVYSSRRRQRGWNCDWSSDVCSSDLILSFPTLQPQTHQQDPNHQLECSLDQPIIDLPLFLINAGSDERSVVTLPLPRAPGMRRLFSYQTGDAPTLLVVLDDLTVTSYDVSAGQATVRWSRAEGLATAFKAEFLDLPHHQSEEAASELELIESGLASRIALHLD